MLRPSTTRTHGPVGRALAATVVSLTAVLLVNPPASAAPTGCSYGNEGSFSWAHCTGGTGQYQAWAQCKPRYPWITNWYTAYGPWRNPGQVSHANCDGNHQVLSYGMYTR